MELEILNEGKLAVRALDNPVRLWLLELIKETPNITVGELYKDRKYEGRTLEQSITSQHLAILKKQNLVTATRDGKHFHYEITDENQKRIDYIYKFCKNL